MQNQPTRYKRVDVLITVTPTPTKTNVRIVTDAPLSHSVEDVPEEKFCLQKGVKSQKEKQKVRCILSSDQMGLILRAADDIRILEAKSMSEVFRTIVPHLATPYRENLSYDGMRSKAYVAEERDKQIAIETLEGIIKKIRGY